ncbi:arginyl-tRNA--protein transferase 1-like isoform X1 [Biomphalaria pfeifferi]|uniref:Arginyl-tRNA--protein transferase 1 n=1 Tax=Biomphalaria pfeifferi TaxID=112525 RepID=A0AAD8F7M0_BIOPF|nr:arginyl-tRNA--protein transferase 1-like isoform X1 [Biomphalaria pfeifferi]
MSLEADPTIVEYFSEHERYKCGYCGSKDTNYSHGMWAHQMTVQDYQDLIDRGWRRSGKYCYKPTMNVTCCPQYTIKCDAINFKLSKSHKKLVKRVNRYLITGRKSGMDDSPLIDRKQEGCRDDPFKSVECSLAEKAKPSTLVLPFGGENKTEVDVQTSKSNTSSASESSSRNMLSSTSQSKESTSNKSSFSNMSTEKHIPRPGIGPDPNKPPCRKSKEIRAERRSKKEQQKGDYQIKAKKNKRIAEKSLEDLLSEPDHVENPAHKLELRLMRSNPPSAAFRSTLETSHSVYLKYQVTIHKDPPSKPGMSQYQRFLCDSPLMIMLFCTVPESHQIRITFQESFSLFKKYQMLVHRESEEECDKMGFRNFLVESPLEDNQGTIRPPDGFGSFHQHYILDGKLIAVGVIDILPACVSSVYLYYDPDYSFLGLGVYSALRELALVRKLHQSVPALKYYYMGFYIHSCPKMRYKGQFVPSFLACPVSYTWVPIEQCRPKLDASKYSRLSESGVEDKDKDIDVNQVLVLNKGNILPYGFFKMMTSRNSDESEVKEYGEFVGKTCAERMLLVRK